MKLLGLALREIVGMFIDDGQLALWSAGLIGVLAVAVVVFALPPLVAAALLLIGCVAILALSARRAVRKGTPAGNGQWMRILPIFAIGAIAGATAPLLATALGNQGLLQLMIATWRNMLFNQGWWPWPLIGGLVAAIVYIAWTSSGET